MSEREKITHKTRKVEIERGISGFGFVLRGAKADGPISEFTPCPTCPAVQYLESVEKNGPAWNANLRPGDFIVEINGIAVIRAGHRQAVELIRNTIGVLHLIATTVVKPQNDDSRVATLRRRPQSRQLSSSEIQDILKRQGGRSGSQSRESNVPSEGQSGQSGLEKPRIPRVPDAISIASSTTTTTSSFNLRNIRASRSISPAPSTNSDNSSSSRNSDNTDKKSKPPPPKRGLSKLSTVNAELHDTPILSPLIKSSPPSPAVSMSTFSPRNASPDSCKFNFSQNSRNSPVNPSSPKKQGSIDRPDKPKRPDKNSNPGSPEPKGQNAPKGASLLEELNKSMANRRARLNSEPSKENLVENPEEIMKAVNYDDIEVLENEINEIKKQTDKIDPSSPFAIAMSAKHRTLTKRREKMRKPLPSAAEINQRMREEIVKKDQPELRYSSEESENNEVMRRFLDSPTKYPFDIPEPVFDSGVETIGSNSTGSDRDEKHQQFLALKIRLKERTSVASWSCTDVCDWLTENGYEQYAGNFSDNEIVGEHLTGLSKNDLLELGITKMGHRISILKLIERLKLDTAV